MTEPVDEGLVIYWRPLCGFCQRLLEALEVVGIRAPLRNIWDDPEAAAFVRHLTLEGKKASSTSSLTRWRPCLDPPPAALELWTSVPSALHSANLDQALLHLDDRKRLAKASEELYNRRRGSNCKCMQTSEQTPSQL